MHVLFTVSFGSSFFSLPLACRMADGPSPPPVPAAFDGGAAGDGTDTAAGDSDTLQPMDLSGVAASTEALPLARRRSRGVHLFPRDAVAYMQHSQSVCDYATDPRPEIIELAAISSDVLLLLMARYHLDIGNVPTLREHGLFTHPATRVHASDVVASNGDDSSIQLTVRTARTGARLRYFTGPPVTYVPPICPDGFRLAPSADTPEPESEDDDSTHIFPSITDLHVATFVPVGASHDMIRILKRIARALALDHVPCMLNPIFNNLRLCNGTAYLVGPMPRTRHELHKTIVTTFALISCLDVNDFVQADGLLLVRRSLKCFPPLQATTSPTVVACHQTDILAAFEGIRAPEPSVLKFLPRQPITSLSVYQLLPGEYDYSHCQGMALLEMRLRCLGMHRLGTYMTMELRAQMVLLLLCIRRYGRCSKQRLAPYLVHDLLRYLTINLHIRKMMATQRYAFVPGRIYLFRGAHWPTMHNSTTVLSPLTDPAVHCHSHVTQRPPSPITPMPPFIPFDHT